MAERLEWNFLARDTQGTFSIFFPDSPLLVGRKPPMPRAEKPHFMSKRIRFWTHRKFYSNKSYGEKDFSVFLTSPFSFGSLLFPSTLDWVYEEDAGKKNEPITERSCRCWKSNFSNGESGESWKKRIISYSWGARQRALVGDYFFKEIHNCDSIHIV